MGTFALVMDMAEQGGRIIDGQPAFWLLCRLGTRLCALPLENVVETMRPLPTEPLAGAPRFVLGLSIIRGSPVPVLDTAFLFDEHESARERWVTIDAGARLVALAVDHVVGVRAISTTPGTELPPLLREAAGEVVGAIGMLDAELLLFLSAARIVPQELHESLVREGGTA